MECEHVLPLLSTISNFGIVTKDIEQYTTEEILHLQNEYEWSHRCCNQIKSNVDMVSFLSFKNYRVKVNINGIRGILTTINLKGDSGPAALNNDTKNTTGDCLQLKFNARGDKIIKDVEDQAARIAKRLEFLVIHINRNIESIGAAVVPGDSIESAKLYEMYGKFKVILALKRADVWSALSGTSNVSVQINEKAATVKLLRQNLYDHRLHAAALVRSMVGARARGAAMKQALLEEREEEIEAIEKELKGLERDGEAPKDAGAGAGAAAAAAVAGAAGAVYAPSILGSDT